jgi:hypothetical protein
MAMIVSTKTAADIEKQSFFSKKEEAANQIHTNSSSTLEKTL